MEPRISSVTLGPTSRDRLAPHASRRFATSDRDGFSRRAFLVGSGVALAGAALGATSSAAAPDAARDAAIDQLADILGGWSFDWDSGARAWAAAGKPDEEPVATGLPRVFLRRSHALQTAVQAEKAGAESPFIAAALLHDLGHVFAAPPPAARESAYDDHHELLGALWLRNVFVPEVSEPVLHHVPGKRYLVATRKDYLARLARDSKDSLMHQGGPMSAEEIERFRSLPFWEDGVRVRLWDDDAKSWLVKLPPLERYLPHLEASLRRA